MHENQQKVGSTDTLRAAIIFYVLSVLLFPISLLGYLIWVGKITLAKNKTGVSQTAQGPLFGRWFMHKLGIRPDEPSHRLLPLLPGIPALGIYLSAWPTLLAHRVSGYVPKSLRYPFTAEVAPQYQVAARMTFLDAVVERHLADMDQFVILGAGFDTRAFNLPKTSRIKAFEVDTPQTQALKRALIAKAGINTAGITFVAANFEQEDWLERLVAAGFDIHKPTLFLWEGVIIYLDRAAVEDTLRKVASTAKGSVIAFDYFTTESLESKAFYWRYARFGTNAAGEPLKFGVDSTPPSRARLAELLQSCGLTLGEQQTLGQETDGKRAWGGFTTALVR
ncbi:MAG: SAM-dependent methyltransferase [Caldilineaceae bacterium]